MIRHSPIRSVRSSGSFHNFQKSFGKWPFPIDPLRLAPESGFFGDGYQVVARIFVAAFRPDGFVLAEVNRESRDRDGDHLIAPRTQMHFDAARRGVESRDMF